MLENERDKTFINNIIVALKKNYGDKANNIIAMILKMRPSQVLKAYFIEELFDITSFYETSEADTDEMIEILKKALFDAGGEKARSTAKTRAYADDLLQKSLESEQAELAERMSRGFVPAV